MQRTRSADFGSCGALCTAASLHLAVQLQGELVEEVQLLQACENDVHLQTRTFSVHNRNVGCVASYLRHRMPSGNWA